MSRNFGLFDFDPAHLDFPPNDSLNPYALTKVAKMGGVSVRDVDVSVLADP